jgi:hypothetical protein
MKYQLQDIAFEWDDNKAQNNFVKHGVTFEEGAEVFLDPFYQTGDTSTDTEERDFVLGYSSSQRMLLVVYSERGKRTQSFLRA